MNSWIKDRIGHLTKLADLALEVDDYDKANEAEEEIDNLIESLSKFRNRTGFKRPSSCWPDVKPSYTVYTNYPSYGIWI